MANPGHKDFSLMFFSRSCIAFSFTFRFMIPFELIFIFYARYRSKFTFLYFDIQLFQHHCWEDYHLSVELPCTFVKKYQLSLWVWAYFWGLYSAPLIYSSVYMPIPHYLGYSSSGTASFFSNASDSKYFRLLRGTHVLCRTFLNNLLKI